MPTMKATAAGLFAAAAVSGTTYAVLDRARPVSDDATSGPVQGLIAQAVHLVTPPTCFSIPGKLVSAKKVTITIINGVQYTRTVNPIYHYHGGTPNPVRWEHVCISHPIKGGTLAKVTVGSKP